jgi:MtN3 and saliva related transmembrane protein
MDFREIFGLVAGALTTGGFVPQVLRVFRMRSAIEISLPFTILFAIGTTAWLSYGIVLGAFPLILWNSIALCLGLALLFAKLRWGLKDPAKPPRAC